MALGLDIYRYQTVTNWAAVKNHGVKFIWVKVTDGGGPAIVRGDRQVNGAKSVGIPVSGYHFAQKTPSPERQADVFAGELRRLGAVGIPPALDLEAPFAPDGAARGFAIRFLRRLQAKGFGRVAVYMNNHFAQNLKPQAWGIPSLVKWIARYGATPSVPWDVHQYSESGRVPGIAGAVDLNNARIDLTQEEDEMGQRQNLILDDLGTWMFGKGYVPGSRTPGLPSLVEGGQNRILPDFIRYIDKHVLELKATNAGQTEAIAGLAKALGGNEFDVDELLARIDQRIRDTIADATIQVDVTVGGEARKEGADED